MGFFKGNQKDFGSSKSLATVTVPLGVVWIFFSGAHVHYLQVTWPSDMPSEPHAPNLGLGAPSCAMVKGSAPSLPNH